LMKCTSKRYPKRGQEEILGTGIEDTGGLSSQDETQNIKFLKDRVDLKMPKKTWSRERGETG